MGTSISRTVFPRFRTSIVGKEGDTSEKYFVIIRSSRFCLPSKPSPSGHAAGNCRPGQTLKKPKYLSACDREECGRGEGVVCMCEQVA